MSGDHYVWFFWSSALLIPWVLVYVGFSAHRRAMLWASLFTMPFGLTEPLFVPEYWAPPSLFDLAARTGFDIESLIFCFAIGGVGAVFYDVVAGRVPRAVPSAERLNPWHRHHRKALAAPFVTFVPLYFLPWNVIYPSIVAMAVGAVATMLCRPDLIRKSGFGGVLFLVYYAVFLAGLEITAPGYIERVWNLEALSGISLGFMPVEELLFAFFFGMYWSGVYEHFTWHRSLPGRK